MSKSIFFLFIIILVICTGCAAEPLLPAEVPETSSPEIVAEVLAKVDAEASLHLFDYDRDAPLDIREESRTETSYGTLIVLSYASPKGGRVPAQMIIPKGEGPFAAIILQHGSLGHKENLTDLGIGFAGVGAVTFMMDDPYSRPGGWEPTQYMGGTWPYYTSEDLDVKIQIVNDLQRAVDLLSQHPQVDPDRLAYFGISFGGAMGGLFSGVETRLKAYVLQVGDGGLVEHTSQPGPDGMNVHFSDEWAELMWPTEPLNFVGRAAPAALLFQNGLHDVNVPPDDAIRYQLAGSEPKTILWYDSAHALPIEAFVDAAVWLQPYLGLDTTWFTPNYRSNALLLDGLFNAWIVAAVVSLVGLAILWYQRRERMPLGNRVLWLLAVLIMGPVGLRLYALVRRDFAGGDPPKVRNQAIALSALSTTAVLVGVTIAAILSNVLSSMHVLVLLLIQYLATVLIAWLFILSTRSTMPSRASGSLLSINLIFTVTLVIFNTLSAPLGLLQSLDPRIWWLLGLTGAVGVLVSYPLHLWLVRRRVERWAPKGPGPVEEVAPLSRLSRPVSVLSISLSYGLILVAIVLVIIHQSGLSPGEVVRLLVEGGI
jgi:dienelactone hydrolase